MENEQDDAGAHMIAATLASGSDRARRQARTVGRVLIGVFLASIVISLIISIVDALG